LKKIINTEFAPKSIGPYSQAILAGDLLFVSGQIPLDPKTMKLIGISAAEQATQILKNIKEILKAADMTFENIVKTTVLLKDINDFKDVNEVYGKFFSLQFPARSAYEVANIPLGALVEIEVIASKVS